MVLEVTWTWPTIYVDSESLIDGVAATFFPFLSSSSFKMPTVTGMNSSSLDFVSSFNWVRWLNYCSPGIESLSVSGNKKRVGWRCLVVAGGTGLLPTI